MKKYRFILLLFSMGLVLSCSKNSDNDPITPTIPIDKSANLLGTGDSANDILSNDKFTKLLVEIAYVEGFRPAAATMTNFMDYLKKHTFKEDIQLLYTPLSSPNKATLSLQEIADLESDNRTAYNNGETLAIYIYFADAPADDDDEEQGLVTLGAVYRNTSMVIHEVTVQALANLSPLILTSSVETATLNHEFGHLFGLVDLGTEQVLFHEDLEAKNHCNKQGCLMRAELQFGGTQKSLAEAIAKSTGDPDLKAGCSLSGYSVLKMLEQQTSKGSVGPDLDPFCIRDLQENGGR